METQIVIEPWFSELLEIVNDWLVNEVNEGRMTQDDLDGSFYFTYEIGAKMGIRIT